LIGLLALALDFADQVGVLVPALMIQLNEAHAALASRRARRQLLAKDAFSGSVRTSPECLSALC